MGGKGSVYSKDSKMRERKDVRKRFSSLVFFGAFFLSMGAVVRSPCYDVERRFFVERKFYAEETGEFGRNSPFNDSSSEEDKLSEGKTNSASEEKGEDKGTYKVQSSELMELDKGREYKVSVKGVIIDRVSGSPVVILVTENENRFVPIWIGFSEATSIELTLRGIDPPRPMTHDLLKNVIETLGGKVEKVKMTHISNNTYYAFIKVRTSSGTYYIDSRPSDALALALRTKSPIYISEKILNASIVIPREDLIWEKLGISIQQITSELEGYFKAKGVVISDVRKDSPAYGKLKRGDIIVEINGKRVDGEDGIQKIEEEISRSKRLEIVIITEGGGRRKVIIDTEGK
jgi:bifunctional DNase/RNase